MRHWRICRENDNYYVSTCGLVQRRTPERGAVVGRIMKAPGDVHGYPRTTLRGKGDARQQRVHRLVASAFIPNPDNKPHVNHIDGVKANNHVSNLEWCTDAENKAHATAIGLVAKGSMAGGSKLTEADIPGIRKRIAAGEIRRTIGDSFGVDRKTISDIGTGKTWKHVTPQ